MIFLRILVIAVIAMAALTTVNAQPAASGPKVAIIFTAAFSDEKAGIAPMVKAINGVNPGFLPKQNEISALAAQIEQLAKEIENDRRNPGSDPAKVAEKANRGEELQRKLRRMQEDAQAAYTMALQAALEPINKSIAKELEAFAKRRSIDIIIDASKEVGNSLIYVTSAADITTVFIAEYNAKQSGVPVP